MKKSLVAMGLIVSATFFISGCTTWNGISQTDKPGSYYVVTNKKVLFVFENPKMLLCTSNETGNLKCKNAVVKKEGLQESTN